MIRTVIFCCLLAACCCLPGCSNPRIELAVASQPNVNPDVTGRPSPLIVKMYELRRDVAFNQADFQTLFTKPMQALNADLVAADELLLVPGEARRVTYKPNLETRFVGVVAGFRNMDRARWRVIKPVDPKKANSLALEFNDVSILMIPDDQASAWNPEKAVKDYEQKITPPVQDIPPPSQSNTLPNMPTDMPTAPAGRVEIPAAGATRPAVSPPAAPSLPPMEQPLPAMRTM